MHHFCAVFNCISQPSGSNEQRHILHVPDNRAKFSDLCLNPSREIQPEAARGGIFDSFVRFSVRPEVGSDIISGFNVGQVGLDIHVKCGDSSSNGSRDIQQRSRRIRYFRPFFNFNNCQPEAVSYVISGMADQDVGTDVCANFGDCRLKPSEASFSALFRTSIISDRKYIVTSYPGWL